MTKHDLLNRVHERAFLNLLLDLIEISDSFDQLQKLALVTDLLYSPFEDEYKELTKGLEHTAKHLRDNRNIGANEFKPACSAQHCPCPFPCTGSEIGSQI